ncbi:hypothetical protein ACWGCI_28425 [Streptomyces sp. NPDC054949]
MITPDTRSEEVIMAIPTVLEEGDRVKIREMGKAGWEALLRTVSPGNYQDPFGDGTSYYRRTADGLCIELTPKTTVISMAPKGCLYWSQDLNKAVFLNEAALEYLLDEEAPRSKGGTV